MSRDPGEGWYVRSRGKVLGPFDFRQLQGLKNQKRLAKFDEVSRGDRRSWVVASTISELFPAASAGGADPGAGGGDDAYGVEAPPEVEAATWYYMTLLGSSPPLTLPGIIRLVGTGVVQAETLVWTVDMPDWVPARTVPALSVSRPSAPSAATAANEGPSSPVVAKPQGGIGFSVAGFILGLLGLFSGILAFVIPTVVYGASRNREIVGIVFFVDLAIWGVLGLLAVTFGTVGMIRSSRNEKGRGFGLGITGLILGILSVAGLSVLIFIGALGVIALDR